ncbi:MAG: hypothetical protein NDI91_19445, partial [Sulfuritalea sp.]|nr:hypothetical protein [Sulfuritalea sp.]
MGDDQLDGSAGNDTLLGGAGNDVYLFGRGSGEDTVIETGGLDTIRIAADLAPADIRVWRDPWDLFIGVRGTADKLTLSDWFTFDSAKVERVEFADGTVWDVSMLISPTLAATDSDDYLVGTTGADAIDAQAGSDEIQGGVGADILTGGLGDDLVNGGAGDDVYIFRRGDGQDRIYDYDTQTGNVDTIQLGPDILPDDIHVALRGRDLVLAIGATADSITIQDWYNSSATKVEQIRFENGAIWDVAEMRSRAIVSGTSGNDTLYGTVGNDTIDGGAGNDVLYGATPGADSGNDTYVFGTGAGQDIINEYGTTAGNVDTIKIVGQTPADVTLARAVLATGYLSSDLVIAINGSTDTLTVQNYYASDAYKIEKVQFDDGTIWTA